MTDRPRILVFAYHNVGYDCLDVLLRRGRHHRVLSHEDSPNEEIWFRSVEGLARQNGIPSTPVLVNTPEWIHRIRQWKPTDLFLYYRSISARIS